MRILLGLTEVVGKRIQKRSAIFILLFFPLAATFHLRLSASPDASRMTLVVLTDALIGVAAATVAFLIIPVEPSSKSK